VVLLSHGFLLNIGLILLDGWSLDNVLGSLLEIDKLSEFLHVYFFVNDCHFLHVSVDSLLQHSVLLQKLTLIHNLQKGLLLSLFLFTAVKTLHAVLVVGVFLVLLRFVCCEDLQLLLLCLIVLLEGKVEVGTD